MVATQAPVLVTGVSGFVGANVAYQLLERGYTVRGTVRSLRKAGTVSALPHFAKYAESGKLTFTEVSDIQTGDFSKALEGVEVVIHVASPFHLGGTNIETDYLIPALQGTVNVLKAAHKAGSVKNFVFTSSFAAVLSFDTFGPFTGKVYTEDDWNSATYESAIASNNASYGYSASKVVAERAAYEYQKEHGLEGKIKVASINPPMIQGPIRHSVDNVETGLNESVGQVASIIFGKTKGEIPPLGFPALADVRDVALAHILAVEKNVQGRFLIYSGPYDNQLVADIAWQQFPEQAQKFNVAKGTPGKYIGDNPKIFKLDTAKARNELGLAFEKSPKESLTDLISQIYQLYEQQQK